jgi:hypothetical protein
MAKTIASLNPQARSSYLTRDGSFYLVVGVPDGDEYLALWGTIGTMTPTASHSEGSPERAIAAAIERGYRRQVAPPVLNIIDAKGRFNLVDIWKKLRLGERAVFEIDPAANRPAHRIRPDVVASIRRVQRRVEDPLVTGRAHRSSTQREQILATHGAAIIVAGWLEARLGIRSKWTGKIGIIAKSDDSGSMGFDGKLMVHQKTLATLERLGTGSVSRRGGRFGETVAGRDHYMTLLHEALHSISPVTEHDYDRNPALEEGLTELLTVALFPELMFHIFGLRVDRPAPSAYVGTCRAIRSTWKRISRGRGTRSEVEFYLAIYRRSTNPERARALARELRAGGMSTEEIEGELDRLRNAFLGF